MKTRFSFRVEHTTVHRYAGAVSFGIHHCRLYPRGGLGVRVREFDLRTGPEAVIRVLEDLDGNRIHACNFGLAEAEELRFALTLTVEQEAVNPYDFLLEPGADVFPVVYRDDQQEWLAAYRRVRSENGAAAMAEFLQEIFSRDPAGRGTVEVLGEVNRAIHERIGYQRRDEAGIQDVDTTLGRRVGSCRDMAWLLMELARSMGLATRFVSGYLYDPPEAAASFNRAVGSMHAWTEIFLPGAGWKGFDPTNGILANHFFIPTAVGGDPGATDPVSGNYFSKTPVGSTLEVDLGIILE